MTQAPATNDNAARPDRLLRRSDVLALLGVSRQTLWRMMKHDDPAERFPRPVRVRGADRFPESAVADWIERQKAAQAA